MSVALPPLPGHLFCFLAEHGTSASAHARSSAEFECLDLQATFGQGQHAGNVTRLIANQGIRVPKQTETNMRFLVPSEFCVH
jgi:hypothetical protein